VRTLTHFIFAMNVRNNYVTNSLGVVRIDTYTLVSISVPERGRMLEATPTTRVFVLGKTQVDLYRLPV